MVPTDLFCDDAGDQGCCCLPGTEADRLEDRCNGSACLAQAGITLVFYTPGQVKHEPDQH